MKRTLLFMAGGAALAVLMFALSHTGTVPVAKADPGVPATVSIDIYMCDGAGVNNPQPHCAITDTDGDTVADTAAGDDDGTIEEGENPEVATNLWIDVDWTDPSDEAFFDLANTYWTTGRVGPDVTGDGWPDPLWGLAANTNPAGIGAAVGEITFKISSNLTGELLFFNNVDDAPTDTDPSVMGQPPVCNSEQADPQRLPMQDDFEIWSSTTNLAVTVDHRDLDGDGCAQSQEDSTGPGADGDDCTLEGPPNGVVMSPAPLIRIIVGSGMPLSSYMGRAFGIARLDILGVASNDVDVNFLIFNLVREQRRYFQITVVQYPGEPALAPGPGDEFAQTATTCPPYWSSPVRTFGVAQDPDYNEDGDNTDPKEVVIVDGWEHRRAMFASSELHDYGLDKSVSEDFDGDGIVDAYDRCDTDPACGSAGDDPDGDFLCGTCETTGAGNGENNGCVELGQAPSSVIPWQPCQDVDGDNRLNQNDNCPTVSNPTHEDGDADGVGDACDPAPDIPGDGTGYAGGFNDADNKCVDQFTIGMREPAGDDPAGEPSNPPPGTLAAPAKYCMGPASEVGATQEPYVNPALAAVGNDPFRDANDDGMPDFEVVAGVGTLYDSDSDEDLDGHSDGCEAAGPDGIEATGDESDALDPTSTPGAPAVAGIPGVGGDCDGGGEWDYAEDHKAFPTDIFNAADDGSSPFLQDVVDSDRDGCVDSEEMPGAPAPKPGATGAYNPLDPYDFYDVPIPAVPDPTPNGTRNQAVAMDDVLGVLFYVGTYDGDGGAPNANGVAYDIDKDGNALKDGRDYDRAPSPTPNPPWNAGPPSGAVAMDDVLAVLAQTGLSCIGDPDEQPVDLVISNLVLTLNDVPQLPDSEVQVPKVHSTVLDARLDEHVVGAPVGHPVQVLEYVEFIGVPDGLYHCVNDWDAVTKPWDDDGDALVDEDPVDGVDNDGDQLENGGKAPLGTWPGECTDTNDNDGDTLVDGDDPDCTNAANPGIDEDPPTTKKWQECTVLGYIVPPSTLVEISNPWCPNQAILDVVLEWELLKSTPYTKDVDMIHFTDIWPGEGPYVWEEKLSTLVPGTYEFRVCAEEWPMPPAVELDPSDNVACTTYTLIIDP